MESITEKGPIVDLANAAVVEGEESDDVVVKAAVDSCFSMCSSEASSCAAPSSAGAAAAPVVKKKVTKKATSDLLNKQLTLKQAFESGQMYDSSHPVAQRITKALTSMLVLDLRPVSYINSEGFTQLFEVLCPRYSIPSMFHFARKAIQALYADIQSSMVTVLRNAAMDMWTRRTGQTQDYMAVTGHWVDVVPSGAAATSAAAADVLIQRQATLFICAFSKRHTAENLLQKLRQVIAARWLTPL